jgi:hypothetical protein
MVKWFQTIWTILVVKQVLQLTFSIFDDQSSNSATFSSKFSLIKKWIYRFFGTLKNNLIYSIPFNQNVKWSISITLVVTITNRSSQGSHKPVLIIITIANFLKGTHESTKIQKHYDIWHCKQVVPTTITSLGIVFA